MKILFTASECFPFIKTGGLADVVGSLPKELVSQGAEVRVGDRSLYIEGEIDERYTLKPEERAQGKVAPFGFKIKEISLLGNVNESKLAGFSISITTPMLTEKFRKDLVSLVKANRGKTPLKMYLYDPGTKYNIEFHSTKFQVAVTSEFVSSLKLMGVSCAPVLK